MEEYCIFFVINIVVVVVVCIYLWCLSSDYGSKFMYLVLSIVIFFLLWMVIYWFDWEMEMISMLWWSGVVLLLLYCLLVVFLWEFE